MVTLINTMDITLLKECFLNCSIAEGLVGVQNRRTFSTEGQEGDGLYRAEMGQTERLFASNIVKRGTIIAF
ncbi:MAG: hypothetical protein JWM16_4982 [Verrucomicrobiales bacterium]|nr:hypothetical protein [Verrucomicrobiales bacterium]